jgi:predicted Zn-dependent protease
MTGICTTARAAVTPQEIVERALAASTTDRCTIILEEGTTAHLRWANNEATTNGLVRDRRLTVIAFAGHASGTAAGALTRSGLVLDDVADVVRAAETAARQSGIVEETDDPVEWAPSTCHWNDPPVETGLHVFEPLVTDLRDAFHRARRGGWLLYGFAQHSARTILMASTTGARLRVHRLPGYVEVTARRPGDAASAWVAAPAADGCDIDGGALTQELERRLAATIRSIALPPGRYEVLLPPSAAADLFVPMYMAAAAHDAHDGRTAFSSASGGTRVGERIARTDLTLRSDPTAPELECPGFVIARASHAAASVFDNGAPVSATKWIADGRLAALVQTRRSARLTGLPVTPYVDNLILTGPPTDRHLEQLVATTRRGLLLTSLWYIREVDARTMLLTGLTRDGVFLVENGEVVARVNNFRFNESPVDLLARIGEMGGTERTIAREWRDAGPRTAMPALRIADFNMSSVSPAS